MYLNSSVKQRFYEDIFKLKQVPADYPSRLIYCGMVRAVDESVLNVSKVYKELGIWEDTLFIMSAGTTQE